MPSVHPPVRMDVVSFTTATACLKTASGISGPALTPCSVMISVLFPLPPPKIMKDWAWLIPAEPYLLEVIIGGIHIYIHSMVKGKLNETEKLRTKTTIALGIIINKTEIPSLAPHLIKFLWTMIPKAKRFH